MRIVLAQLNPTVGDISGNVKKALKVIEAVVRDKPDLIVFPELFLTGYPPKDLLEKPVFIAEAASSLKRIAEASGLLRSTGILIGLPVEADKKRGKGISNAAVLLCEGKEAFRQSKSLLPTYDVFDEARYFDPARDIDVFDFKGERLGITICEDAWNDPSFWRRRPYSLDPVDILARKGASILINISASPFSVGKERIRFDLLRNQAKKHGIPLLMVNQVGGNDDLIFDGRSFCINSSGELYNLFPSFEEHVGMIDTTEDAEGKKYEFEPEVESVYRALVLGTRDYVRKCGFEKAVLGLSGGIDSAVASVTASDALGAENVTAISMPSPYSSKESVEDAAKLAQNLGIELVVVPIGKIMLSYQAALAGHFKGLGENVTEENIQARIRGNILMAFSNKFSYLPLSTGNKSELAVGYCTLYGDMSGGLAVISDVPKTLVYEIAEHINKKNEVIPRSIIEKAPSAELKPGQKDQDTLPPYDILDGILHHYIDEEKSPADIVKSGFDEKVVEWVVEIIRKNEYKRKQAPPGLKVTSKAFGTGRRMPIAARYEV